MHGDRAIGRRTLPIILPGIARYTILAGLTLWSIGLALIWKLDWATASVFLSLAGIVVSRFQLLTSVKEDQVSYYWYNVSGFSESADCPGFLRTPGRRCGFLLRMHFRGTTGGGATNRFASGLYCYRYARPHIAVTSF